MRFSILLVDLTELGQQQAGDALRALPEIITQYNTTTICLRHCIPGDRQGTNARLIDDLASMGFKFESVFHETLVQDGGARCVAAVISQLPVLGSAFRPLAKPGEPEAAAPGAVVGCRLGLSPGVTIDLYCADTGAASGTGESNVPTNPEGILDFVNQSPALFSPAPAPEKRQRGRPRKKMAEGKRQPVRLVFVACPVPGAKPKHFSEVLEGAGYMEAGAGAGSLYLRPALRPTEQQTLELGKPNVTALYLVFEV